MLPDGEDSSRDGAWITVTIVNRGNHPVRVAGWGIHRPDELMRSFFEKPDLPPIRPSDATTLKRAAGEPANMGSRIGQKIAIYVELTTGDEFTSRVFPWHVG